MSQGCLVWLGRQQRRHSWDIRGRRLCRWWYASSRTDVVYRIAWIQRSLWSGFQMADGLHLAPIKRKVCLMQVDLTCRTWPSIAFWKHGFGKETMLYTKESSYLSWVIQSVLSKFNLHIHTYMTQSSFPCVGPGLCHHPYARPVYSHPDVLIIQMRDVV